MTDAEVRRRVQIKLQLANGRCLRFDPGMDTATLIRVVEAA